VTVRDVDTIVELVDLVDLTEVRPYEASARRVDHGEPTQELQVLLAENEDAIEVRARMSVRTEEAELLADYSVVYTVGEELDISKALKAEFVERVGIMAVYPFLREAIFAGAARIQVPAPVVGLLRAGQFSMEPSKD
jgi:hypothetical protein